MEKTVVHVLATRIEPDGKHVAVARIRSGVLTPPTKMTFSTPDGHHHSINITNLSDKDRFVVLELSGEPDSLSALNGGYYLYGESG